MKKTILTIYNFALDENHKFDRNGNNKIQQIVKILLTLLILKIAIIILILVLGKILNIKFYNNLEESESFIKKIGKIIIAFSLIPLFEELAFRLFLKKSKRNFIISFTLILFITSIVLFDLKKITFFSNTHFNNFFLYCLFLLTSLLSSLILTINKYFYSIYYNSTYRIIISSSLLFAILHFSNFNNPTFWHYIFLPLLISPHFLFGIFASYIRLRFGFLWVVLFHIINNFISTFPQFIILVSKEYL